MPNRRYVSNGLPIGAALPASPVSTAVTAVLNQILVELVLEMPVTRVRIGLCGSNKWSHPDDENHYWAEAFGNDGKFYYRAKGVTIEIPEYRYQKVIANPYLYYFSSALWLHYQIVRELKKQRASA